MFRQESKPKSKHMFLNIILNIFAFESINFDTKYLSMYHFGRSCDIWIWSLSKVISMTSEAIP